MRLGSLFWKLLLGNALLIAAVLGTCAWLIADELNRLQGQELTANLRSQATILAQTLHDRFDLAHAAQLDRFAKRLGRGEEAAIRLTLLLPDGTVLADSEADVERMERHADRTEIQQALANGWGMDMHDSQTVGREMQYVAVRIGEAEAPRGVIRVSVASRVISQRQRAVQRIIWTVTLLGLAASIVFAVHLARLWSKPIHRIMTTAHSLSRGDLSARARVAGRDEIALLANSLNEMREHLAGHLQTIDRQRRTLESLMTQLREGVIVAGPDGRIVLINPEAIRLLGLGSSSLRHPAGFKGLAIRTCVSQPELQDMLLPHPAEDERRASSSSSRGSRRTVCEIHRQGEGRNAELTMLARASDIMLPEFEEDDARPPSAERRPVGRMVVLTDITELARTVRVKSDFASNASHELRTPLSSIRAAVETLMDCDCAGDPEAARHFLDIIDRQSRRMEDMVVDLLDLSRIESAATSPEPETVHIARFLDELRQRSQERLDARQLQWSADQPAGLLTMAVNPHLLRIAMDNLLDNAIKFTEPGGRISVICSRSPADNRPLEAISITVGDTGCGIAPHEQERVFERFYQVEKARSGVARGTGLGLSIVRHAVAAMKGTVDLQSEVGKGTRVTITIPQSEPHATAA